MNRRWSPAKHTLDRRLHGAAGETQPYEKAWRPHYSGQELPPGHRLVKDGVRCRCGATILVVPCLACGCDPTAERHDGKGES